MYSTEQGKVPGAANWLKKNKQFIPIQEVSKGL